MEIADHPFILEFPFQASDVWRLTNLRRMREHRTLTLLLNVLLEGRTSFLPTRMQHFWASVGLDGPLKTEWVQNFFPLNIGEAVVDNYSNPVGGTLHELKPEDYYLKLGIDGIGMRVPADLDDLICRYKALPQYKRVKFDRSTFWIDIADRQWNMSMSASFASYVTAVEAMTEEGTARGIICDNCGHDILNEIPGAMQRFRDFFDKYAPNEDKATRRKIYDLRSDILHGSQLMQADLANSLWIDPTSWSERELYKDVHHFTHIALRNWLKEAASTPSMV